MAQHNVWHQMMQQERKLPKQFSIVSRKDLTTKAEAIDAYLILESANEGDKRDVLF